MQHNPLFNSYQSDNGQPPANDAAELIRQKVADLYNDEPSAREELQESQNIKHQSKHQRFMYELGTSGKDLATIQTEWHTYYQSLPPHEKHQVWQEFYSSHDAINRPASTQQAVVSAPATAHPRSRTKPKKLRDVRSIDDVAATIRHNVSAGGKLKAKHHLQSLLFGLGMGSLVMVVVLFGLFNEIVLAPLYQPSRHASATPIIVDATQAAPTDKNEVIIPKINLEIPVDYSQTTIDETNIEQGLEKGIVHYPITSKPGENGNAAFFGHSSSNIFNKGKYKFAFVLLHAVTPGDTFYVTYNKKVYVYKVISRTIVDPSDVGVLDPVPGQTATATLITCDPPGTSLRRLVVVGQQISPDPSTNAAAPTTTNVGTTADVAKLPGNGRTLGGRLLASSFGKFGLTLAAIVVVAGIFRRYSQMR
jgi:LPXTG-site transpeptidase (sortase) family protein